MTRPMTRFGITLLALSWLAASAAGSDPKDTINASIRALRALQNDDGSYGPKAAQPLATARMLVALGASAEHYTVFDGPFVRRAVEALLSHQADDGSFGSAETTLTSLAALKLAAPGSHEESLRRGSASLGTGADSVESRMPSAGARYLKAVLGRDAPSDRAAIDGLVESVCAAQAAALSELTVGSSPAVIDRLLALIDLQAVLDASAVAAAQSAEEAEIELRDPPSDAAERRNRIEQGLQFLASQQQDGRFGFGKASDPGVTAIALSAVIKMSDALGQDRPDYVSAGLDYLLELQKPDGGIYERGLANYITSVSVEAMAASGDERFRDSIRRATAFLRATQLDEDEGYSSEADPYYGGFGYGSSEKPDLSNTQMAVQAMHDAGVDPSDETWAKVVGFLARCQNLEETGAPPMEAADGKVIVPGDDGGAIYRPGDSKAGTEPVGGDRFATRSYGSMTYALLKSYLFAGLDPSDERVAAAIEWICSNYTVDVNPGFEPGPGNAEYQGLFYYYLTMARALKALGQDQIEDGAGHERDWAQELTDRLFSLQHEDGYWLNRRSSRWMEGNSVLTTSYALLTLVETG